MVITCNADTVLVESERLEISLSWVGLNGETIRRGTPPRVDQKSLSERCLEFEMARASLTTHSLGVELVVNDGCLGTLHGSGGIGLLFRRKFWELDSELKGRYDLTHLDTE